MGRRHGHTADILTYLLTYTDTRRFSHFWKKVRRDKRVNSSMPGLFFAKLASQVPSCVTAAAPPHRRTPISSIFQTIAHGCSCCILLSLIHMSCRTSAYFSVRLCGFSLITSLPSRIRNNSFSMDGANSAEQRRTRRTAQKQAIS